MKTVKVSDEIYDFLVKTAKEIKEQDNRATRSPYFFQVQEDEEVGVPDGCGTEVWVMDGEFFLRTDEDIKAAIFDYNGWDIENEETNTLYDDIDEYDIESILEVMGCRKVNVDIRHTYSNCFLTFKAYEEHLRQNKHNLNNPKSYLNHAYRNPEMDMLFKFFEEVYESNI